MYFNLIGIDGSGKDTIVNAIFSRKQKRNLLKVKEPGGTFFAEKIRDIILHPSENIDIDKAKIDILIEKIKNTQTREFLEFSKAFENEREIREVFLFAAARNELFENVIKTKREKNDIIGNRSVACSMAYQGHAKKVGMDFVWEINSKILNEKTLPDFEIFIDVPVSICKERTKERTKKQPGQTNHFDIEDSQFFELAREGYLLYYEKFAPYRYYIIDAGNRGADDIVEEVLSIIEKEKNYVS